jgi:hypothetical protein
MAQYRCLITYNFVHWRHPYKHIITCACITAAK